MSGRLDEFLLLRVIIVCSLKNNYRLQVGNCLVF